MLSTKFSKKLVFLGTGGTIAGAADSATDNVGYLAAQVGVAALVGALPGLSERLHGAGVHAEQVVQIDSKDMGWLAWTRIAEQTQAFLATDEVVGVVITHGTDTLEETAFFLSKVLAADLLCKKPVVLTCAMRPATSSAPDGPQNLLDAVSVALSEAACGVLAVCAGDIHAAKDVQKVHPYRLNAFDSGDAGPLGCVEEGTVRWFHNDAAPVSQPAANLSLSQLQELQWPRIEVVMNHVNATGAIVRSLCSTPALGDTKVMGIVVAGTGNGTMSFDLEQALLEVQRLGVRVTLSTRCAYGRVIPSDRSTFSDANGLSPVKARIAMALDILADRAQFK